MSESLFIILYLGLLPKVSNLYTLLPHKSYDICVISKDLTLRTYKRKYYSLFLNESLFSLDSYHLSLSFTSFL